MKIRVEREKIVKALRKLEGIEVVLEDEEDAKEAIDLIISRTKLLAGFDYQGAKDIGVSEIKEYKTSAVAYTISYLLEFPFDDVDFGRRAEIIRTVQSFFEDA